LRERQEEKHSCAQQYVFSSFTFVRIAQVMESWLAAEERGETQLRAVRASSIRLRQALTRVEQGVAKKVKASCLASCVYTLCRTS
jgi:hypothetical protein